MSSSYLNLRVYLAFLVSFIILNLGVQILCFPYIDMANGLGYDGVWYQNPSLSLLSKVDNYHLFRVFPSKVAFMFRNIFALDDSIQTTVRIFQLINFLFVGFAIILISNISKLKRYSLRKKIVLFVFCFLNFSISKDFAFSPVMTEASGFLLSVAILWAYLKRFNFLLYLFLFLSFFCIPAITVFYLVWFWTNDLDVSEEVEILSFNRLYFYFSFFITISFALVSIIIIYGFHRVTLFTFPDDINLYLFPVTLILNSYLIFLIINKFREFVLRGFSVFRSLFRYLNSRWVFLLISAFFFQFVLGRVNNNQVIGYSAISVGYPIYINLKPLIGIVDNLSYYGPVLFVFLFLFFKNGNFENWGFKGYFLFFFLFLLIIKPEARHTLFLIPLLSITILDFIDDKILNFRFILFVSAAGLFFSKFWYPVHWADFPPTHLLFSPSTEQAIYQQFPVQHYFMFIGPMMGHAEYFVFLALELIFGFFFYKFLVKKELSAGR